MSQIIDRRLNGRNKSAVNRQRFIRRYRKQIKSAVAKAITKRSITDMDKSEKIIIPKKDLAEPHITHAPGGKREYVHPGNKEFLTGDRIQRPKSGAGQGAGDQASKDGSGEDNFVFELSREEFLDLYFDDLSLPDLVKKELAIIPQYKFVRAGVTTSGIPTNINIIRSMRQATARRMALGGPYKKRLKEATIQLEKLLLDHTEDDLIVKNLKDEISSLKNRISRLPFIDSIDLRYNYKTKQMTPATQAVMFCIMDVSGSMDEIKKDIAKRFFILLYLFLRKNYKKIEIVFIRHHTSAKEVDEHEFFYSRETGGTVVSSALELMRDVMRDRYPASAWNIYAAQASDGDNWNADSPYCQQLLAEAIMPDVQYFSYIEIMPRHHQSLWEAYASITDDHPNFSMKNIDGIDDIYPVFRELFQRKPA